MYSPCQHCKVHTRNSHSIDPQHEVKPICSNMLIWHMEFLKSFRCLRCLNLHVSIWYRERPWEVFLVRADSYRSRLPIGAKGNINHVSLHLISVHLVIRLFSTWQYLEENNILLGQFISISCSRCVYELHNSTFFFTHLCCFWCHRKPV